jgi:hypothetical protein
MKKIWFAGILCVWSWLAEASHIVGGEMALVHLGGSPYFYRLELILYYDYKNGLIGGDRQITVRIFSKRTNTAIRTITLFAQGEIDPIKLALGTPVEYFQPECSDGSIETNRVYYESSELFLSPDIYNDPQGYYIAWERCCRNYVITNIYSENPASQNYSRIAGQIFYLEFPPVTQNGEEFINSSPRLFPPLSDYACPNRDYFVDFAGTDPDGDSLVYSLVTPLNSIERFNALPPGNLPNPGPYPEVEWKPPFNLNNIVNGSPDLDISSDGLLTVRPSSNSGGLFVFAVKCEEFRNGVKLGEVRRDFQLLVQNSCPVAEPPQVVGRKKGDVEFTQPNQGLTVSFSNSVPDDSRCVQVQISDPDSEKFDDNFQERVSLRVIPINFKLKNRFIADVLPQVSTATLTNGSTVTFDVCLPQCPYTPNGFYQIGIIAFDDACTLPLSDTLRVTVFVEPPPNAKPTFTTPNADVTLNEGDPALTIPIQAVDGDGEHLDVAVINDGFVLGEVGMTLNLSPTPTGQVNGQLVWDTRCDVYDFTRKTNFNFKILVDDRDQCSIASPDTMLIALNIILPGNADPLISSTLPDNPDDTIRLTKKIFETLTFDVLGTDADNDLLVLGVTGLGFNPQQLGATFPGDADRGNVQSPFAWYLDCASINLDAQQVYDLRFIVVDNANKCRFYKADTLLIRLTIEPPDNAAPELTVVSTNPELMLTNGNLDVTLASPISLALSGFDADVFPAQDHLIMELISAEGSVEPEGYTFQTAEGPSLLSGTFTWEPTCDIFVNGIYTNEYTFAFRVKDDRCFNLKADTVEVDITISDVDGSDTDFLPPNFFTPNGDEQNPYFAMAALEDGELVNILPLDNCVGQFVSVRIYNRWGRQVFESADRDFRWYGEGMPNGVYYYLITYTHKEYRGSVTLRF